MFAARVFDAEMFVEERLQKYMCICVNCNIMFLFSICFHVAFLYEILFFHILSLIWYSRFLVFV